MEVCEVSLGWPDAVAFVALCAVVGAVWVSNIWTADRHDARRY